MILQSIWNQRYIQWNRREDDLKKGNYRNLVVAEGVMGIYEILSE